MQSDGSPVKTEQSLRARPIDWPSLYLCLPLPPLPPAHRLHHRVCAQYQTLTQSLTDSRGSLIYSAQTSDSASVRSVRIARGYWVLRLLLRTGTGS